MTEPVKEKSFWKRLGDKIIGCQHNWTIIREITVTSDLRGRWQRYHLQCTKCGMVKCKDMN